MEAYQGAVIGDWERWPVQSRRRVLHPIKGLSTTLGQLLQDTGEAPNLPDHCTHQNGLLRVKAGVQCVWCDSFPAFYNPQFFGRPELEEE